MDPLGYLEEVLIVLVLIGANGVLAMLEMALVSSRKTRLTQRADEGDKRAAYVLKLAEEPTDFLSTVQVGITLVGIGTGVYSGAAMAAPLALVLQQIPALAPYAGAAAYTIVVALVTYLSIILGELIPKRIAISNPESMIISFVPLVKVLIACFRPMTALLSVSTKFLLRFTGNHQVEEQVVTEEEVRMLIEQGAAKGVFNKDEQQIIDNAFTLDDMRVGEIMIPRTKIAWLDLNDPLEKQLAQITEQRYSCFVVADEDLDNIKGILYTKRFLIQGLKGEYDMEQALKKPVLAPESMSISQILNLFKHERVKIALIINEFGSLAGLVTLRDVVEHLVGDVPSDDEEYEPEVIQRDEHSWYVDGLLSISEFVEYFDLDEKLVEDSREYYNTVGGLVVDILGNIPREGDTIEIAGLKLEVVDMDGKRVDKVLVTQRQLPVEENTEE